MCFMRVMDDLFLSPKKSNMFGAEPHIIMMALIKSFTCEFKMTLKYDQFIKIQRDLLCDVMYGLTAGYFYCEQY